jgi:transposase
MWLLEGYPVPDHNTLARFIGAVEMNAVLVKVHKLLIEFEELKFEHAFIDGTKIEANANRYTFVWKSAIEKHRAKLLPKIEAFLDEIYARYGVKLLSADGVVNYLDLLEFERVFGKGSRKCQEQRDLETARDYAARLQKYDTTIDKIGESRKSMSKTDPDATFMRLKEDHMRNGQLKPAYNIQLCIESEYITGIYVSSDRNDQATLIPFLEKLESEYGRRHKNAALDAGYESEENYAYLQKKQQIAYIKPQNYEQQKTREYKRQIGRKENMRYDSAANEYTCANGKKLKAVYNSVRKSQTGYEQTVTKYRCEDCTGCAVRNFCTKAKDGKPKELECSRLFEELRAASYERITSELGIQLRINRSIQAEGTFGVIKQDYGFRRFYRRGTDEVVTELALVCLAFNLNKFHSNLINERTGFALHEISSA